jgi:hypothetical protein
LFVPTEKDSLKGDNKKSASVLSSVAAQDLNKRIDPRSQNHASEKKMPPNQNNGPFPRDDKIMVENASKPQLTLIAENGSKSASRNSNPALSDSEDNKEELPLPSKEPIRLKAAPAEKNPNQLNLFPKTGPSHSGSIRASISCQVRASNSKYQQGIYLPTYAYHEDPASSW